MCLLNAVINQKFDHTTGTMTDLKFFKLYRDANEKLLNASHYHEHRFKACIALDLFTVESN